MKSRIIINLPINYKKFKENQISPARLNIEILYMDCCKVIIFLEDGLKALCDTEKGAAKAG